MNFKSKRESLRCASCGKGLNRYKNTSKTGLCTRCYNKGRKNLSYSLVIGILAGLLSVISLLPVSYAADYLPHKQSTNFTLLVTSSNASSCNFTYIQYPDNSIREFNSLMIKSGTIFTSNVSSVYFNQIGTTCMFVSCYDESANPQYESGSVCREVTYNGKEVPSGIIIVFFSLAFLVVIGFLSYLIIYNIGHLGQMDYDLGDLIKNVSAYFVLLGLYILSIFYMGNETIDTIMSWILGITGFTNVAMSFLFFIIVLLAKRKANLENKW